MKYLSDMLKFFLGNYYLFYLRFSNAKVMFADSLEKVVSATLLIVYGHTTRRWKSKKDPYKNQDAAIECEASAIGLTELLKFLESFIFRVVCFQGCGLTLFRGSRLSFSMFAKSSKAIILVPFIRSFQLGTSDGFLRLLANNGNILTEPQKIINLIQKCCLVYEVSQEYDIFFSCGSTILQGIQDSLLGDKSDLFQPIHVKDTATFIECLFLASYVMHDLYFKEERTKSLFNISRTLFIQSLKAIAREKGFSEFQVLNHWPTIQGAIKRFFKDTKDEKIKKVCKILFSLQ